jgi:hypothetical protein
MTIVSEAAREGSVPRTANSITGAWMSIFCSALLRWSRLFASSTGPVTQCITASAKAPRLDVLRDRRMQSLVQIPAQINTLV